MVSGFIEINVLTSLTLTPQDGGQKLNLSLKDKAFPGHNLYFGFRCFWLLDSWFCVFISHVSPPPPHFFLLTFPPHFSDIFKKKFTCFVSFFSPLLYGIVLALKGNGSGIFLSFSHLFLPTFPFFVAFFTLIFHTFLINFSSVWHCTCVKKQRLAFVGCCHCWCTMTYSRTRKRFHSWRAALMGTSLVLTARLCGVSSVSLVRAWLRLPLQSLCVRDPGQGRIGSSSVSQREHNTHSLTSSRWFFMSHAFTSRFFRGLPPASCI